MTEEALNQKADAIMDEIRCSQETIESILVKHLRLAIKESSEEKDEVIRRLANESTSYRLNIAHRPVS